MGAAGPGAGSQSVFHEVGEGCGPACRPQDPADVPAPSPEWPWPLPTSSHIPAEPGAEEGVDRGFVAAAGTLGFCVGVVEPLVVRTKVAVTRAVLYEQRQGPP